jgi:flagellar basal-body rod protein FlgB
MEPSALTGITGSLVRAALDGVSVRQLATANNIANANTPGYAPLRVEFEDQLAAALRDGGLRGRADPGRLASAVSADATPGAKVQLDIEAAQMARDVLHYQALLRALRGQMDLLQTAINEGRR